MEISVINNNGCLVPADQYQAEELNNIPKGSEVVIEYRAKRNGGNHRRFFKFIRVAFDMQEHYTSREALRFALIVKAGYVEKIESHKNGAIALMPQSLKFSEMGEEKFKKVFKDVIGAFIEMLGEMGRPISEDEMMQIIEFD